MPLSSPKIGFGGLCKTSELVMVLPSASVQVKSLSRSLASSDPFSKEAAWTNFLSACSSAESPSAALVFVPISGLKEDNDETATAKTFRVRACIGNESFHLWNVTPAANLSRKEKGPESPAPSEAQTWRCART